MIAAATMPSLSAGMLGSYSPKSSSVGALMPCAIDRRSLSDVAKLRQIARLSVICGAAACVVEARASMARVVTVRHLRYRLAKRYGESEKRLPCSVQKLRVRKLREVKPPGATSTSAWTSSGLSMASRAAAFPPRELPMKNAGGKASAVRNSRNTW